jgi:hypothetical protein
MKCTNCQRELVIGTDVLGLQEGVIGTRGLVPLAAMLFFCGEECLKEYHDDSGVATFPGRKP